MSDFVVWLDSEKAHIFNLKSSGIEKSNVEKKSLDHHTHNKKEHHIDPAVDHFYHDIVLKVKSAEQLLILGPGLGKNHFKSFIEKHHVGDLAKKVIGIENSDHPTDNQVLAAAREFFKSYNLFNNPIKPA